MAVADVNAVLTANQIAYYAKQAGFPAGEIALATAIAMAESGGNTKAHNTAAPDDSYGLWQINMYGSLAIARRALFGITANDQLYDPTVNARAALLIRRGQGWTAWSVYTSGAYKKHLVAAEAAAAAPSAPNSPDGFTNPLSPLNPVNQLTTLIDLIQKWIKQETLRVAMFFGGGFLIWLGIQIFVTGQMAPKAREIITTAKSAVTKSKGLAKR